MTDLDFGESYTLTADDYKNKLKMANVGFGIDTGTTLALW